MKRIIIVTLQGANIGNRLQNYALQKVLVDNNCEVHNPIEKNVKEEAIKLFKTIVKSGLFLLGKSKYKQDFFARKRKSVFNKFTKRFIINPFQTSFNEQKKWNDYDFVITGSDQVWHKWSEDSRELPYYYLSNVPEEKRIAYAPNFGFSSFTNGCIEQC